VFMGGPYNPVARRPSTGGATVPRAFHSNGGMVRSQATMALMSPSVILLK
jgi:hypothetical protein